MKISKELKTEALKVIKQHEPNGDLFGTLATFIHNTKSYELTTAVLMLLQERESRRRKKKNA